MNTCFAILMHGVILADSQPSNTVTDVVLPLVPWVIVAPVVLFVLLPWFRRQTEKGARLNQRAIEHWDVMERKLDRIIALLETGQQERKNSD